MARILIADDDRNFGTILKSELEEDQHAVDLVPNGIEAVLNFIDHSYDFVLLDIRMPRLGGTDALRIIKKIAPHIPVITFSGNAGIQEREESVKIGSIKCLAKPFKFAQLKEVMKDYIAR